VRESSPGRGSSTRRTGLKADGSLEREAADWVREQLEPNFEVTAQRIPEAVGDASPTEELMTNVRNAIGSALVRAKPRQLGCV